MCCAPLRHSSSDRGLSAQLSCKLAPCDATTTPSSTVAVSDAASQLTASLRSAPPACSTHRDQLFSTTASSSIDKPGHDIERPKEQQSWRDEEIPLENKMKVDRARERERGSCLIKLDTSNASGEWRLTGNRLFAATGARTLCTTMLTHRAEGLPLPPPPPRIIF